MFKNWFKTTVRYFWRNRTFSLLNVMGLAIGIACAGLIFLWVENEMSYDNHHQNRENLYVVKQNWNFDGDIRTFQSTPALLAGAVKQNITGVSNTCRSTEGGSTLLFNPGNNPVYATGIYADPSIFDMFTLPFAEGNSKNVFSQLHSVVLTRQTAKKFFGTAKTVVGRRLRVDNSQDYIVTGVLEDMPVNSTLEFEWIMPFEVYWQLNPWLNNWGANSLSTYVQLLPSADVKAVDKSMAALLTKADPTTVRDPFLFSMTDWRLRDSFLNGEQSGGRIVFVKLFSLIAWIILIIACINFMNLSTARSEKRAREVGVRKVMGAGKDKLILQFMGEAVLMAALAGVSALIIMYLALPSFNVLVEKQLSVSIDDPVHLFALFMIVLVCGIVAGSYPSLYLSNFKPVYAIKAAKSSKGSAVFLRQGLVVLQFTISIALIIATIIINKQVQHARSRELGFDKDRIISLEVNREIAGRLPAIRRALISSGYFENAAFSDYAPLYDGNNSSGFSWSGKDPARDILISRRYVSPEFMSTIGMKIVSGRGFHPNGVGDSLNVIITESFARLLGKGDVIGNTVGFDSTNYTVIGVVNDYVYGNMYGIPDPVIFYPIEGNETLLYARMKPGIGTQQSLTALEKIMKQYNPGYPFQYTFLNDQFRRMFLNEILVGKLSRLFAFLAIVISCLGLFGLAAYTAERRTKEIGIRKVLGASARSLAGLLTKDFLKLVIVSCLVAFPLSGWLMNNWLREYPYRITISWWIFLMAGCLALLIAVATISVQAIRTALANPTKSLRTE